MVVPHPSMDRFAGFLALQYDANRTRHAYYRQIQLTQEQFSTDPATLSETQLRDYFLFLKLKKQWKPKSILRIALPNGQPYVAAPPPPEIAEILIEPGAGGAETGTAPPSGAVQPVPNRPVETIDATATPAVEQP